MFEKFTTHARNAVETAQLLSADQDYLGTEHLLWGLAAGNDSVASRVLAFTGADLKGLGSPPLPASPSLLMTPFSPAAKHALSVALHVAMQQGHERVGSGHLLLGVLTVDANGHDILRLAIDDIKNLEARLRVASLQENEPS